MSTAFHGSVNVYTPPSSDSSTGSVDASSDIVPNPFHPTREWIDLPLAAWPPKLALDTGICSTLMEKPLPRGKVPPLAGSGRGRLVPVDGHLRTLRDALATGNRRRALHNIRVIVSYTLQVICLRRKVHLSVDKRGTCKMGRVTHWGNVTCAVGAAVEGLQIFLFTDAHRRNAYREGERPQDVDPPLEQQEEYVDIIDLVILLGIAQRQLDRGVPMKWNDDNFTVHLMYPDSSLKRLIIITAHVPRVTALAVAKGGPALKKIKVTRDIVPILDGKNGSDSDFVKVLVGMVDAGVQLYKMTSHPDEQSI